MKSQRCTFYPCKNASLCQTPSNPKKNDIPSPLWNSVVAPERGERPQHHARVGSRWACTVARACGRSTHTYESAPVHDDRLSAPPSVGAVCPCTPGEERKWCAPECDGRLGGGACRAPPRTCTRVHQRRRTSGGTRRDGPSARPSAATQFAPAFLRTCRPGRKDGIGSREGTRGGRASRASPPYTGATVPSRRAAQRAPGPNALSLTLRTTTCNPKFAHALLKAALSRDVRACVRVAE